MITGKLNPLKEDTTSTKNSQVLVLIIALTTVAISLTTHEIWQDEAEPIAKIHAYGWNLWALMESFRGDVHLPLHYVLLYPFLNIGNLILGIGSAHIIKFFTFLQYALLAFLTIKWVRFPFSALFLSSYYCLFEYGTISRCYLLALILLLTIFRGIVLRQRASVWDILACFLFPLTHLLSVVYSGFLLIYCLLKRNWGRVSALTASYPIALYYFYFRSETAKTYEFQGSLPIGAYVKTFIHSIIAAWLPFSTESIWWNQSFATDAASPALPITILLLSLIVLAIVKLYRFDPLLTIASCLGACSDVAILSIKYPQENFRHVGYAVWPFLGLFVLVLSLPQGKKDKSEPLEIEKPSIFPPLLRYSSIVVLAMHSVFGIAAVYKDVTGIFAFPKAQIQVLEQLTKASPNIA
ncbi:MAG TPA: hypothetical protein DEV81_07840, partial [Cyanobacteria bacterium UBA11049]|nr:hypothetical protein [Cyanobacteria bacterium UBA11049]